MGAVGTAHGGCCTAGSRGGHLGTKLDREASCGTSLRGAHPCAAQMQHLNSSHAVMPGQRQGTATGQCTPIGCGSGARGARKPTGPQANKAVEQQATRSTSRATKRTETGLS